MAAPKGVAVLHEDLDPLHDLLIWKLPAQGAFHIRKLGGTSTCSRNSCVTQVPSKDSSNTEI